MAEELKEGDVVLCINGATQKAVDEGAYSRFFPIQGKAYTIKKVEFDDDACNTFVSLVEDTFYETPSWDVCRFLKIESGAEQTLEKFSEIHNKVIDAIDEAVKLPNAQGGIPVVNEKGGVKNFGGKPEPRLLFQSMPEAVMEVIKVLTYGSRKYSPDNWKLVDDFAYHDALQRHYLAKCTGEQNDPDTNLNHLAHMACSVLFLLQKEIDRAKE